MSEIRPITIAISAMGGQGGGVLSNWIRDMAESNGYAAQSTSVPGVAQRTGATIYYLELFEQAEADKAGKPPVLAMTPVPGDVDIVIAAELVEAGRALQRGFVSADRTTLIATTHRSYTVAERQDKGNGLVDSDKIVEIARQQAKKLVAFDMEQLAKENRSVISSVLFGALAGSGVLPFSKEMFEQAVSKGGIAVETNLAAFDAAYHKAQENQVSKDEPQAANDNFAVPEQAASPEGQRLLARVKAELPEAVQGVAFEGVRQLVDYQDPAYADQYLDKLAACIKNDSADKGYQLTYQLAANLALWMAFQDTIRVADQKVRAGRMEKIREEVKATDEQIVFPIEFLHPRLEEICDSMPKSLGRWVLNNGFASGLVKMFFEDGKKIQTGKLRGFLLMYFLASMRGMRRSTLRYEAEHQGMEQWLEIISQYSSQNYSLAVELVKCQRLIKGYGDTHARGTGNFKSIIAALPKIDTADTLQKLHKAALEGEDNKAFDAVVAAL